MFPKAQLADGSPAQRCQSRHLLAAQGPSRFLVGQDLPTPPHPLCISLFRWGDVRTGHKAARGCSGPAAEARPGSGGRAPVPMCPEGAERGHLPEPSPALAPTGSGQWVRERADPESTGPRIWVAGLSPFPLNVCTELRELISPT